MASQDTVRADDMPGRDAADPNAPLTWTAPKLKRLAAGEAEFGGAANPDSEGTS